MLTLTERLTVTIAHFLYTNPVSLAAAWSSLHFLCFHITIQGAVKTLEYKIVKKPPNKTPYL